MNEAYRKSVTTIACSLALLTFNSVSHAHFLWLKTISHDEQTQAFLFFGEDPADEAYHLPERLAKTKVWRRTVDGERTKLATDSLETDDRTGLVAAIEADQPCVLEAAQTYGIYGRSLLVYYAKHVYANSTKRLNAAGQSKDLKLEVVPQSDGDNLVLTAIWDDEPLAGAELVVTVGDAEPVKKSTDDEGRVTLKPQETGLVSVLTNHFDKSATGEVDGKPHEGVLHYASLTFEWPGKFDAAEGAAASAKPQAAVAPLPEPLASFGAAVVDGWLYVYGGHIGGEHEHSAANLSQHFRRINLDESAAWEELPMQTPLQGLALVAHGGKVYRIGGLNARNPTTDDDEDLHSVAEFAEFDPTSGQWRQLAPLPAPRSSHEATVIGDRLYVVGGWQLAGKSRGEWQPDALVYDFAKPQAGWQTLPEPPFTRRALAVSHSSSRLVVIGGLDENGEVSQRVDIFDPETSQWSHGPDLPGAGLAGFGGSACHLDGELYVSGLRGIVYRLNETGPAWEEAARKARGRFFHQLLPAGHGRLLAVGGASRTGHLDDIEWVWVGE